VRITVSDPDIVARFGIDHYYNLFVFTDDSQGNPLVFCVRELPQGMPTGDGERFGEYVRVAGFFLKTWAYRVERPAETTVPAGSPAAHFQLAPLLIGEQPVWYRSEKSAGSAIAGAIAGGLFVLALLGIWFAAWRYGRGDREFRRRTIAGALTLDTPLAIDEIPLGSDGVSDFRGLEEEEKDEG
jgi:hypothetical protein